MGKHAEWRKIAKKERRKRIRQAKAQERDNNLIKEQAEREKSPTYQSWLLEQEERERFELEEQNRIRQAQNEEWCRIEQEAQKQWKELQVKLQAARDKRAKQNAKIKLEWEQEQKRLKELKEQKEREIEEKQKLIEQRNKEIDEFLEIGGDTPEHLNVVYETNPSKEQCPFFQKTSACRFFDACSRNHVRPGVSRIIVIPNFYSHYSLEKTSENEHGSDNNLEFENDETYNHFKEFFYDVVPEMEKCGRILNFQVCCNHEAHLRGNVYVEYKTKQAALKSYKTFNGRWYAGKQLNVEFCSFDSWKKAICGLYFSKRCPKGSNCNFLHVYYNPKNLYNFDNNSYKKEINHEQSVSERRSWRWSESPEKILTEQSPKIHSNRKRRRSRSKERRRHSNSNRRKRSKSKSSRRSKRSSSSRHNSRSP